MNRCIIWLLQVWWIRAEGNVQLLGTKFNLIYSLEVSILHYKYVLICLKGISSYLAVRWDFCPSMPVFQSQEHRHSNTPSGNHILKLISSICCTILRIMYLTLFELHNTAISCREELCCQSLLPFASQICAAAFTCQSYYM